jgi:hypothetical protein
LFPGFFKTSAEEWRRSFKHDPREVPDPSVKMLPPYAQIRALAKTGGRLRR